MRKNQTPMEVFNSVVGTKELSVLDPPSSHAEVADNFAFKVVRDSLVKIGVDFMKADDLAGNHGGPGRRRYLRCLRVLGIDPKRKMERQCR